MNNDSDLKTNGPRPHSETLLRRLDYLTSPAAILIGFGLGAVLVLASQLLPLFQFSPVFISGLAAMVLFQERAQERVQGHRLSLGARPAPPALSFDL